LILRIRGIDTRVAHDAPIAVFLNLADVVEVKTGSRPLADPLYPAEWIAETQFRTVDHPS